MLMVSAGAARGAGTANTLEARRRAAPGATLREAIANVAVKRKAALEKESNGLGLLY